MWQAQPAPGSLQAALRVVGAEPLKAAALRAVAPYQTSTGGVCLQNHFRFSMKVMATAYYSSVGGVPSCARLGLLRWPLLTSMLARYSSSHALVVTRVPSGHARAASALTGH